MNELERIDDEIGKAEVRFNDQMRLLKGEDWNEHDDDMYKGVALALCEMCVLHDRYMKVAGKPSESFRRLLIWLKQTCKPSLRKVFGTMVWS